MKIDIQDYGICRAIGETKKEIVAESVTGYFLHSDDMEFLKTTDTIYPRVGMSFGISYSFETGREGVELVDFICRIRHPKLVNPETLEEYTETIEAKDCFSNEIGNDFYTLEFDWEIQYGAWIFEIIHDGQILCSQTFWLES